MATVAELPVLVGCTAGFSGDRIDSAGPGIHTLIERMGTGGRKADEWQKLGRATMTGHLLEGGAQVCGGYVADPGYKDVPGLDAVGFPICLLLNLHVDVPPGLAPWLAGPLEASA